MFVPALFCVPVSSEARCYPLGQRALSDNLEDSANRKIKHIFPTEKGKAISPNISGENEYSERVALQGLSEEEATVLIGLLQRVRKNVEGDWEYVKKGNKRNY